jgi:hypothetical protein
MALDQSLGTGLYDPTRAATDAVVTPKAAAAPSIDPANLTANDLLEASRREQSQKAEKEIGLAQNTAEAAERKAALSKEFADKAMNMPEHQQIKDLEASRQKAFIPTQETANDLGALFMLTNILGFAIGGKTKGNAQAALSAMNGMLEGHNKGREDVYKREKDIFEENQKTIDRTLSELHNSMKEGMQLLATDREAGNQIIDAALSKNNARFLQDFKAKNGNAPTMEVLEKLMEIQRKKDETIQNQKNKDREYELQKKRSDIELARLNQGSYQYMVKDGKTYAVNTRNPEDVRQVNVDLSGATRLGAKPASEHALKKGEFQANAVREAIGRPVDPDAASKLMGTIDFEEKLRDLQKANSGLKDASGLKVEFSDYVNKYLSSVAGPGGTFEKSDLDAAFANLQNDKSFRAMSDKSKTLSKQELDTVMAYLQSKYGNRAPVAEFKAAQQVISRKNADATSYNEVMNKELRSADSKLIGLGFRPEEVVKAKKYFKEKAGELEKLTSQEDAEHPADITNLLNKYEVKPHV